VAFVSKGRMVIHDVSHDSSGQTVSESLHLGVSIRLHATITQDEESRKQLQADSLQMP